MRRRQFLAAATAAAALPTAGCTALTGPRTLSARDPVHEDDEVYVRFDDGNGDEVMNFDVRYWKTYSERYRYVPFDLHVWHRRDTHLDSLRYTIRTPTTPNGPLVTLYFERPGGGPWSQFTYESTDRYEETVVAVDDLGGMGDGSVTLGLLAAPNDVPPELGFSVTGEFQVSERGALGTTYTASETLEFTVEREPSA